MLPNRPTIYTTGYDATKGLTLEQLVDFNIGGAGTDWLDRPKKMTAYEAYKSVAWYKRCVDVRARGLASLPWAIYGRGDDPIATESDDLPDELAWFRPGRSLALIEIALVTTGSAFALVERVGRRVDGLFHYNPFTIKPKYSRQGITGYERKIDGQVVAVIPPEEMLAIFSADPFTEQGPGATDGHAAVLHAQVLQDLTGYASENLRSGLLKKPLFFGEGRAPEPDERERTESELTRWIMGRGKTRVRILSSQIKPEVLGSDLSDLDSASLTESHQRSIATGLGVPHSLVMSDAANFATAKADQLNFLTTTLRHESLMIEEAMNQQVFDRLNLRFRFEIERTEAVQSEEQEKAMGLVGLVAGGILTRDEARLTLGYDPLEEDEEPMPEPENDARALDIRRWRSKVEKRGRGVKFSPDALTEDEADAIRGRLASGADLEQAFSPPF